MTRQSVLLVVLSFLGCGRSSFEGASADPASSAPDASNCTGEPLALFLKQPEDLCPSEFRTLPELRAAMVGRWVGTVGSYEKGPRPPLPDAIVEFRADGTASATVGRIWPSLFKWDYSLDAMLATCDAKGSLFERPSDGRRLGGIIWWARPCGNKLALAFSEIVERSPGAVRVLRLERE